MRLSYGFVATTDRYGLAPLARPAEPEWAQPVVALTIAALDFSPPTRRVTRNDGFITPLAQRAMEPIEGEFAPLATGAPVAASAASRAGLG